MIFKGDVQLDLIAKTFEAKVSSLLLQRKCFGDL